MCRRLFAALLAALVLCAPALAEAAVMPFSQYADALAGLTGAAWTEDGSADLMAFPLGDADVYACLHDGNVVAVTVEAPRETAFDEEVDTAVRALGWLSDEGLSRLCALTEGEEIALEGCAAGRVGGETRVAVWICPEAERGALIWQPVHGGEKYHADPTCSGMDAPCLSTVAVAEMWGLEPCGRCMEQAGGGTEGEPATN